MHACDGVRGKWEVALGLGVRGACGSGRCGPNRLMGCVHPGLSRPRYASSSHTQRAHRKQLRSSAGVALAEFCARKRPQRQAPAAHLTGRQQLLHRRKAGLQPLLVSWEVFVVLKLHITAYTIRLLICRLSVRPARRRDEALNLRGALHPAAAVLPALPQQNHSAFSLYPRAGPLLSPS